MDARGGTITWYLTANDADFNSAMMRTRASARSTGRAVERDFGRGMKSAQLSLDDFRQDLNRSAQVFRDFQIALRGFQMTSLIIGATLAGGAIVELVGALTAATQAILVLPSVITTGIGAMATFKTAVYGVGDAFKALLKGDMEKLAEEMAKLSPAAQEFVKSFGRINEAFKPIRTAVQEAFFQDLGKQMESVAQVTLPVLRTGMLQVATAMNGMAKEAARVVKEPFFQNFLADSLKTTATATTILTGAVEPLAASLAGLVKVGNPFTIMLSQWIVDLSNSAALYINSAEGQKQLTDAINVGIDALQRLGDLIGSVFNLFVALFKVSNEDGLSLIGTLTQIVDKMTEWVNSAEGSDKLRALFEVTNDFLRQGSELIGGFVNGILGIIEQFNKLPDPIKEVATNLILIAAVASPVLGYLSSVGASFNLLGFGAREVSQAFTALTGIDLGTKFSNLSKQGGILGSIWNVLSKNPILTVLGILASIFVYLATKTTLFKDAWQALEPAFTSFGEAIAPILPVIGDLITQLVGALAPIIPVIAQAFAQILVALLPLIPLFLQIVQAILPVFVTILQAVVTVIQFLVPILLTVVQIIAGVLTVAINIVIGVLQIIWAVIVSVGNAFIAAWNGIAAAWGVVVGFFTGIWSGIVAVFNVVAKFFGDMFTDAWDAIKVIWNTVLGFFQRVWDGIARIFSVVVSFFKDMFQRAWDGIKNIWNAVGSFFNGIWAKITEAFKGAFDLGKNIVDGLGRGILNGKDAVINKVKEIAAGALNAIKNFFGIKSPSRVMAKVGGNIMAGLGLGIDREGSAVVSSARTAAEGVLDAFSGMQTGIGNIGTDFSINGNSTATTDVVASLAPSAIQNQSDIGSATAGAVIYQTNEVHTDLDMDQVNRNLTWELSKI